MPVRILKGAYLFKFTRYVEWPTNAFADAASPFVIGLIRDKDNVAAVLKEVARDRCVENHPVVIRTLSRIEEARDCHVLYVAGEDRSTLIEAAKVLARSPVLLVGDRDDALSLGGAIGFFEKDNNLRIRVRPSAAERGGLQISSKLCDVADQVDRRPMPEDSPP